MSNDVDRTLWVGNLSEKVTDELLYELFLQAGPLDKVSIPKDRETGKQKLFAFVTFSHDVSVPYTIQLMDGLEVHGRNLRLQCRPGSIHQQQQQQQQQQQPNVSHGNFRNVNNPYQSNQSSNTQNPYRNNQNMQMNAFPPNPYTMTQPTRNQTSGNSQHPGFHRSNTWHGNDLSTGQQERDQDERKGQDRERDRNSSRESRDRDRSHSRKDRSYVEEYGKDDYRNSPNSYNDRNSNAGDFESRRKNVLQKHDRMLQGYHRENDSRPSPPYHNQRRGRH